MTEASATRATRKRVGTVAALLILLAVVPASLSRATAATTAPSPVPRVGIVCTEDQSTTRPIFDLTTKTGYISLPDGNTTFMWGYSNGSDGFQHPGPVLCVHTGDEVTVILHNSATRIDEPTSIVFPGQENVLADGLPADPEFSGATMTSLTKTAAAGGGTVTYTFTAGSPGTYLYESGTNAEKQVRMGLFGTLIVRPTRVGAFANERSDSRFTLSEEFMVLLSEIDPFQHQAVEQGKPFNINNYHPRYWLINGRGFPDSIADNNASWLPTQPYGALAAISEYDAATHPYPAMGRYLNVGTEDYPFHPHANNGVVIGRDGQALEGPAGEDLSFEKFAINLGPSQTWDVLFKWYDAEHYDATTNPVPVNPPDLANSEVGTFYSGSPYLGSKNLLPPTIQTLNQCGEYYIITHNHALFQITSWGANMTGPITYMRIDPPKPNNC